MKDIFEALELNELEDLLGDVRSAFENRTEFEDVDFMISSINSNPRKALQAY